jgi:hypothetical protein
MISIKCNLLSLFLTESSFDRTIADVFYISQKITQQSFNSQLVYKTWDEYDLCVLLYINSTTIQQDQR